MPKVTRPAAALVLTVLVAVAPATSATAATADGAPRSSDPADAVVTVDVTAGPLDAWEW